MIAIDPTRIVAGYCLIPLGIAGALLRCYTVVALLPLIPVTRICRSYRYALFVARLLVVVVTLRVDTGVVPVTLPLLVRCELHPLLLLHVALRICCYFVIVVRYYVIYLTVHCCCIVVLGIAHCYCSDCYFITCYCCCYSITLLLLRGIDICYRDLR